MKEKKSIGIACVRFVNGSFELILVKKRYTYAFVDFVNGKYSIKNQKQMANLFNNMTTAEKIDILRFDFDILWARIWLVRNATMIMTDIYKFYQNKKLK